MEKFQTSNKLSKFHRNKILLLILHEDAGCSCQSLDCFQFDPQSQPYRLIRGPGKAQENDGPAPLTPKEKFFMVDLLHRFVCESP